jgi:hypothetical protein
VKYTASASNTGAMTDTVFRRRPLVIALVVQFVQSLSCRDESRILFAKRHGVVFSAAPSILWTLGVYCRNESSAVVETECWAGAIS